MSAKLAVLCILLHTCLLAAASFVGIRELSQAFPKSINLRR